MEAAATIKIRHRDRIFNSNEQPKPRRSGVGGADPAVRKSCLFCHQTINSLYGLHELVSHVAEMLHGHGLVASGHDQQDLQHIVGIPNQIDQVLTAGTAYPSKPVFDRPLPRTSPFPDDLHGLMGGAQFAFQSIGDGSGIRSEILAVWKNYALFSATFCRPSAAMVTCNADLMGR